MEQELSERLTDMERKIDALYVSVEKLRKYFLWTLVITVVTVVLPIIALLFAIPWVFGILSSTYVNMP